MGLISEKEFILENIILSNFYSILLFKIIFVFEISDVKNLPGLAPKTPNYVTFVLNNCTFRFPLSRAAFLFPYIATKY